MNGKNTRNDEKNKNGNRSRSQGRNRKSNGKSCDSRSESKEVELKKDAKAGHKSTYNDPKWYALNPQLLLDSASLSYNTPLGVNLNLDYRNVTFDAGYHNVRLPGVAVINLDFTLGSSGDATSALNMSAFGLYSFVRHANSGHANYDAPDLMLYIGAMDSVHGALAWFKRLYGLANLYNVYNRYYPKAIVEAMGVDFNDLIANLPQVRYFINQMASKMASMCIPANMSLYARHTWLYSGIYMDGDVNKAQSYLFNPHTFLKFTENEGPGVLSGLTTMSWRTGMGVAPEPVSKFMTKFRSLLDPITSSEDMNIMSGDILKAYGSANIVKVDGITSDYTVIPQPVGEVLTQINNLTVVPAIGDGYKLVAQTEQGVLTSELPFDTNQHNYDHLRIINMPMSNVTPGDTMVATRLMLIPESVTSSDGEFSYEFRSFGTEIVHDVDIREMNATGAVQQRKLMTDGVITSANVAATLDAIATISAFDYCPLVYLTGAAFPTLRIYGNMANTTVVSYDTLRRMHETAVISELDVPQVASPKA